MSVKGFETWPAHGVNPPATDSTRLCSEVQDEDKIARKSEEWHLTPRHRRRPGAKRRAGVYAQFGEVAPVP